mgnify:CR=1 FL=1
MKIKEKIAMVWTFPIMLVTFGALSVVAVLLYSLVLLLNVSGTTQAAIYLFDAVKHKLIERKLKKLIKEDEKKHKFGSDKTD